MKMIVEEVEEHFFSDGGGKKSAGKLKRCFFGVFWKFSVAKDHHYMKKSLGF